MYINNDDFEKWMERLSKKLNDIGKDLKSLVNTNEVSTRTKNCWIIRICVSCSGAANALFNATEVMAFYPPTIRTKNLLSGRRCSFICSGTLRLSNYSEV